MKIRNAFFLCVIILLSCKKDITDTEQNNIDYRLKYIGEYEFFSCDWEKANGDSISDTITYIGDITIVDHTDSLIRINYREGPQTYICNGDSMFGAWVEPYIRNNGSMDWGITNCFNFLNGTFPTENTLHLTINVGWSPHWSRGLILQGVKRNN